MRDWAELDHDLLELPIDGKTYRIPELAAGVGLRVKSLRTPKPDPRLSRMQLGQFWRVLLSDAVVDQMEADGVTPQAIRHAGQTALADFQYGRETAEAFWDAGVKSPELTAALAAAAAKKTRSTRSTSTASAKKTPSPASTKRTTSRQGTPQSNKT